MQRILIIPAGEVIRGNILSMKNTVPRLKKGLELWKTERFYRILVTGGIFNPPEIQTVPAADLMRLWLIEHGVDDNDIIVENRSRDTFENIFFSLKELRERDFENSELFIVSHPTHLARFELTFKALGKQVIGLEVNYPLSLLQRVMEFGFKQIHRFDPRGEGFIANYNRRRRSSAE